ncbi:transposase [Bifidobacterium longum]|uniref:transposase n=1 Tax=Bifidobacterium longum TaxID=216816 RepID=UPI001EE64A86|nr:transposase [Bifidobacterium longum]
MLVNPAYTSQTCSEWRLCDSRNRESQADFECKQCHMSMNADLNAANNILKRGIEPSPRLGTKPSTPERSQTPNPPIAGRTLPP